MAINVSKPEIRVGIAGFDHVYLASSGITTVANDPHATLTMLAHRDARYVAPLAADVGARFSPVLTDVLDAEIDLLVTACATRDNAALVAEAARRGIAVVSVKPFAMDRSSADDVVAAVDESGSIFIGADAGWRLQPAMQLLKRWIDDGTVGGVRSVLGVFRAPLPDVQWLSPRETGRSWWLDPENVFGGGWLDHAIYFVDLLRWLGSDEIADIRGTVANLQHAAEALEDYGAAEMRLAGGGAVHIECGWTVASEPELLRELHVVGANGQAVWTTRGSLGVGTLDVTRLPSGETGWATADLRGLPVVSLVEHAIAAVRGETQPVASVHDARANLEVCLTFYERAERI